MEERRVFSTVYGLSSQEVPPSELSSKPQDLMKEEGENPNEYLDPGGRTILLSSVACQSPTGHVVPYLDSSVAVNCVSLFSVGPGILPIVTDNRAEQCRPLGQADPGYMLQNTAGAMEEEEHFR